jgi:hypothetical protein
MRGKPKFAVAITAISLAPVSGGIAAAGAQARNQVLSGTEVLSGTTTTTGGFARCGIHQRPLYGWTRVGVTCSASGTATGPYPGPFSETGHAHLLAMGGGCIIGSRPGWGSIGIGFTINSGATTISGTIHNDLRSGVLFWCCIGSFDPSISFGPSVGTYTATIQTPGQTPQPISGAAAVSGGHLYTAKGSQEPLTATLTLP